MLEIMFWRSPVGNRHIWKWGTGLRQNIPPRQNQPDSDKTLILFVRERNINKSIQTLNKNIIAWKYFWREKFTLQENYIYLSYTDSVLQNTAEKMGSQKLQFFPSADKFNTEIMLDVVMGVVDMEVDKVADEVTNMVAARTDYTHVTVVSEDTYWWLYWCLSLPHDLQKKAHLGREDLHLSLVKRKTRRQVKDAAIAQTLGHSCVISVSGAENLSHPI